MSYASNLQKGLDMPWTLWNELRRRLAWPFIRLGFAICGVPWGRNWRVFGMPLIQRCRGSRIELGDRLELRSWPATNPLFPHQPVVLSTRTPEAVLRVGNSVGMSGSVLVAANRIEIGDRVSIGANSVIVDTDFHPVDPEERRLDPQGGASSPVIIEDDVFIGAQCLILKGVTIGAGSMIGAGSVVTRSIPPGVLAAGNPARVIRPLS